MNKTKPCEMCRGKGTIRIADYIDQRVIPDRNIKCPVCNGQGVIELHSDSGTADGTPSAMTRLFQEFCPSNAGTSHGKTLQVTHVKDHTDAGFLL